jgi:hypothetical protein
MSRPTMRFVPVKTAEQQKNTAKYLARASAASFLPRLT